MYNAIRKRHILHDTCAAESVFNDSSLLHNVKHAPTPIIVGRVNPKRKPLIIKKRGVSAFGNVYYSPDCSGNILSFGNAVRDCTDVKYLHDVRLNTRCHLLAFAAKVEKQLQATVSIQ